MSSENLYFKYCDSIEKGVSQVEASLNRGVLLTDREKFDFAVKAVICGNSDKVSMLGKLPKIDNDLVTFYSKYFLRSVDWLEEGYTFKKIKKFVRAMLNDVWFYGFSSRHHSVKYSDKNGVLRVALYSNFNMICSYNIRTPEDVIEMSASLVSYFGSMAVDREDREFFEDYFYLEMGRLVNGEPSKVYIDKRKHSLEEVIKSCECKKSAKGEKVVKFKVS